MDNQAEIQKMLEEAKGKAAEHIFVQVLQEFLEIATKEKEIVDEAKAKVA